MVTEITPFTGIVIGIIVGALATAAFGFPRIARAIGKMAAVVFMGCGAGLITWGLMSTQGGNAFESLNFGPITFFTAAQTLGWGAGSLVAGISALILSFVGRSG